MKRLVKWLVVVWSFGVGTSVMAKDFVDSLIETYLPDAHVGVMVIDPTSQKTLYERNVDKTFVPASNAKLLIGASALLDLGPDYKFQTNLYISDEIKEGKLAGEVLLEFSGDPTLTSKNLFTLVKQLKTKGVQVLEGDIILDDSKFNPPYHRLGSSTDSAPWGYDAPVTTIILDKNAFHYNFEATERTQHNLDLALPYGMQITDRLTIEPLTITETLCAIQIDQTAPNHTTLHGCWAEDANPQTITLAIPSPFHYAASVIQAAFKELGIEFKGTIKRGRVTPNHSLIAQHRSERLLSLLSTMEKESDNLIAGSITKTLGYKLYQRGTFQAGATAMKAIIQTHTGASLDTYPLFDGAGASRYDLITPRVLINLLNDLYHMPKYRSSFKQTLAVGGRDGTLATRFVKGKLRGHVFAKTGSMKGVSALSGYLEGGKHGQLIFVILINNMNNKKQQAVLFEDQLVTKLYHKYIE